MSPTKCPHVEAVAPLDWPTATSLLETRTVLCGGNGFLDYELRCMQVRTIRHGSSFMNGNSAQSDDDNDEQDEVPTEQQRDLLSLSSHELEELTYYEILEVPTHASQQVIKKGYHAACLLYHPDKTGRSEEDHVFLTIKSAFDTLSDEEKRKSYDSTALVFDDSIPSGGESPESFYTTYGPVFERNLRFDTKLRNTPSHKVPLLGNDKTSIDKVHAFYEYWIHFDSWRDFTLKASQETEHDLETADSRYEKRYMQKEIARRAKALKREEMARINLLVERSMATDPRLKREKQRQYEEKQERLRAKQEQQRLAQQQKQQQQERLAREEAQRQEQERDQKAQAKAIREKEKKQLRKMRQSFRKLTMTAYQQQQEEGVVWETLEDMNDDIELLCNKLTEVQLSKLTEELGEKSDLAALEQVKKHAARTRAGVTEEEIEAERQRDEARAAQEEKARLHKASRATAPWSKEELSALAKAVKKYPPGGANRWETIALFINNLCKPQDPRTKEECIEKYNQIANAAPKHLTSSSTVTANDGDSSTSDGWTEQQDKQLQEGLKQFPVTMDKNERWTSIAKGVDGKNKKECVQRFKAIRAALKNK